MVPRRLTTVLLFIALLGLLSAAPPACNVRNSEACQQAAAATTPATTWKYNPLESRNANGTSVWLLRSAPFDIVLEKPSPAGNDEMIFIYKAVDDYEISVSKDVNGVRTANVKKIAEGSGSTEQKASEAAILDVLAKLINVEELNNGETLSIRSPTTTITFDKFSLFSEPVLPNQSVGTETPSLSDNFKELRLDVNSFFVDGHFKVLEVSAPVKLYLIRNTGNSFIITVNGVANTMAFEIVIHPDGWVSNSTEMYFAKEEPLRAVPGDFIVADKLRELLKNLRQVSIKGRRLEFTAADGTRVAFDENDPPTFSSTTTLRSPHDGILNYYTLLEGSYQVNGHREKFYSHGHAHPVSIQTIHAHPGRLEVILYANDIIKYHINFNPADGWVSRIYQDTLALRPIIYSLQKSQDKVTAIIGSTQQVSFEEDGLLQFITNNSATRVAFTPLPYRIPEEHGSPRQLQDAIPKYYRVVPGSYQVKGQLQRLFVYGPELDLSLQATEVSPGRLDVIIRSFNTIKYQIYFSVVDGWVSSIVPGPSTSFSGPPHAMDVEFKLRDVIGRVQQIAFETDDLLQFITDNSATRIAFRPDHTKLQAAQEVATDSSDDAIEEPTQSIPAQPEVVRHYDIVARSYQVNGKRIPLFPSEAFPVTIETTEGEAGRLDVTLNVVNSITYQIYYNVVDGWVSNIDAGLSTLMAGSPESTKVEDSLRAIIGSAQQIAFETDGLIQFIKDNSATRVAFKLSEPAQEIKYFEVVADSYQVNGERVPLFPVNEFSVELITKQAAPGLIEITLIAPNTITYTMSYNEADGWVSAINVVYTNGDSYGTPEMLQIEDSLRAVIGQTQQIAFEQDGLIQFIKDNSATRLAFKPQDVGTAGDAKDVGAIMPGVSAVADTIEPGKLMIIITTVDAVVPYEIFYNEADGVVLRVEAQPTDPAAEIVPGVVSKLLKPEISSISRVDVKDDQLNIFKANGEKFLTFVPEKPKDDAVATESFSLVVDSYKVNDKPAQLFNSKTGFPVTLEASEVIAGQLEVTLRAGNTLHYLIIYNPLDGVVKSVTPRPVSHSPAFVPADTLAVEKKLNALFTSTKRVSFQPGLAEFIDSATATSIAFKAIYRRLGGLDHVAWTTPSYFHWQNGKFLPHVATTPSYGSVKRYTVLNDSYQVNGQKLPLFPSYEFPVTLETSQVKTGRLDVTLSVINSIKYQIYYNVADGWVSNVVLGHSTNLQGPGEQLDVENKLKAIIGATQQLAFESDGLLQLITNNSATRVAFKPAYRRLGGVHKTTRAASSYWSNGTPSDSVLVKRYSVVEGSYQLNGKRLQIFPPYKVPVTIETSEVTTGRLDVTLNVVNSITYQIYFSVADGWVSNIEPGLSTLVSGPPELMHVEDSLKAIIGSTQQIAFEQDGLIQFIKDNSATRVAFKLSEPKYLEVVPGSYQVNGKRVPLFPSYEFPVYVETSEVSVGRLEVTLNVVNSIKYQIYYNIADGWVSKVVFGHSTNLSGPWEETVVENKLKAVIGATQQLAFESDGLLQLITNNSATRVAFKPRVA